MANTIASITNIFFLHTGFGSDQTLTNIMPDMPEIGQKSFNIFCVLVVSPNIATEHLRVPALPVRFSQKVAALQKITKSSAGSGFQAVWQKIY